MFANRRSDYPFRDDEGVWKVTLIIVTTNGHCDLIADSTSAAQQNEDTKEFNSRGLLRVLVISRLILTSY